MHYLTQYGILQLTGEKTAALLQGQFTCDVSKLAIGQGQFGAYCDHRGRMLASFWVIRQADCFLLVVAKDNLKTTQNELTKFALFSKVHLEDVSKQWQIAGCRIEQENSPTQAGIQGKEITQIPVYQHRLLLVGKQLDLENPLSEAQWRQQNIEDKFAEIYTATSGLFTPHMLNYPALGAVSFNKGCYRGQEIIARTEHLGKAKRELMIIDGSTDTEIGQELLQQGKKAGVIVEVSAESSQLLAVIN